MKEELTDNAARGEPNIRAFAPCAQEARTRRSVVAGILALALMVSVACDLAGPETIPKDPGTVIGRVTDSAGAPIANVWVYVNDIPNAVGTTFSVGVPTNATGVARIEGIPAGQRRVEARPPPGYTGTDLIKTLDVVKEQSVNVAFTLDASALPARRSGLLGDGHRQDRVSHDRHSRTRLWLALSVPSVSSAALILFFSVPSVLSVALILFSSVSATS